MSQFKYLNLDSKDSVYNTNQTNNTFQFNANSTTDCPNSYNIEWTLRVPIQNPKRIWLRSVELPIGFSNIRSNNGSNTMTISTSSTFASGNYTITLTDKIYTSLSSLITDLNTAFAPNFIFSIKTDGFIMVQSPTIASGTIIYVKPSILANTVLGFDSTNIYIDPNYNTPTLPTRCGKSIGLLNPDNYVNMWITNLSSSDTNNNGVPSSFKIPVSQINGTVMYSGSNAGYDAYIPVNTVNVINKINVVITDRYGFNICSRGLDWSCTLAIEM